MALYEGIGKGIMKQATYDMDLNNWIRFQKVKMIEEGEDNPVNKYCMRKRGERES